ncbi:general secretion pathway protein E [Malonomonas rubra DSM 5091]|uniref:General secretion pathway protein E n=1 Tax=Malonomonas rubra DSM 5091 TaxID=1122189 RepID=A0A1M6F3V2_MALRU|nr:GspE/PulE family protein [Malonomonas rubra]SHI92355.1 general secretion pathway protein E [Malonomonas rubra DSM 5091]
MTSAKKLTIASVAQLLKRRKLLADDQLETVLQHGEQQAERLLKQLSGGRNRKRLPHEEQLSPAEVISSFNLEIPGSKKLLTEDIITEVLARAIGLPYLKIDPLKLDLDIVTNHISRAFALRNLMVPVDMINGKLVIAVSDPSANHGIEELQRTRRIEVDRVLASRTDILKVLGEFFGFRASVIAAETEAKNSADISNLEQHFQMRTGLHDDEGTDKHIIAAVDFLLQYAFDQRASDIHIEPKRDKSLIRLRVDGVLHNIHNIPKNLHPSIVSRIKLLARLDLAEKRRPQDGRIKTEHKGKEIELRVSTLPVAFGEKVVIRIFDPDILMQDLEKLGFEPREFQLFNSFIHQPNGIILVTGPTGSGKTTTLYSSLRALSSPEINIVTVEDPIEMVLEEFNQVGVQSAIDVTFSTVLRNILRQDPDIIMIGEIRDKETADNAVQAALTGHLVLSTLHTNDAPSSITRLLELGIPYFLLASTLIGVNAQRLVRKICTECKKERLLTEAERDYLDLGDDDVKVWEGEGCNECRGTGYKGRIGIFEVLDVNTNIKASLSSETDLNLLTRLAREDGMSTLRESAIRKMLLGETTFEEVIAVTG